jgi:predicted PurR-regulated permease PerM
MADDGISIAQKEEPTPAELAAARGEMLLPRDPRNVLLTAILTLLVFYSLYAAREIMLPIMFALLLKLLLTPVQRVLTRLHVPKLLAALMLVVALMGGIGGLGWALSAPAAEWLAKVPRTMHRLEAKLEAVKAPVQQMQEATKQVEKMTDTSDGSGASGKPQHVTVKEPGLSDWILSGTRSLMGGFLTTLVLLFFLLLAGDLFLRRFVEILPRLSDKKQAVEISNEIERNISAYLLTITVMNAAVGVATGLALHLCGFEDALLWGAVAFLLNYIPILGPLVAAALFFVIGMITYDDVIWALLPAGIYLCIHFIEGEAVTPMLLARRFTLNPVLVVGSLVFWHWMWGIPGVLLAVPMLAVFKIVCDRVRPLMALGHFIGGEGSSLVPAAQRNGRQASSA